MIRVAIPQPLRIEHAARDSAVWLPDSDGTPLPWPLATRIIFLACGFAWAALVAFVVSL